MIIADAQIIVNTRFNDYIVLKLMCLKSKEYPLTSLSVLVIDPC